MEETIILAVDIETKQAQTQLDLLGKTIEDAQKKQEELNKQFSEGSITLEEYNKGTKENTKEIKAAETATKNLTTAVKAEENSITALSQKNKELIKERNSINTTTEEGRKRIQEINAQIDQNNTRIKDNVSQLEKQKINIGNYVSALDGVKGSLDKVIPGLGGMTDGIIGVSNGAKALGATPLLAIFTILSTVVPMVVDYFKSFAPVMDALEDAVNAVTGTFKGLFENFDLFIKAISGSGKDWDALKTAINETRAEGQRLLDVQRELDDAYLDYQLRASKGGVEIKKLLLEAKNRTLTEKERQDKLNQALAIEVGQREELIKLDKTSFENSVDQFIFDNTKRLKGVQELIEAEQKRADNQIAQESRFGTLSAERREKILAERDAEIERIKTSDVLINQLKQTEDRYEKLQILRQSGLFDEKDLQNAVDAFVKYQGTVEGGVAIQERIQNQLDALADKEIERNKKKNDEAEIANEKRLAFIEKINAAEKKLQDEQDAFFQKLQDDNEKRLDEELKTGLELLDIDRQNKEAFAKQQKDFDFKQEQERKALIQQQKLDDQLLYKQKLDIINQTALLASAVFKKSKEVQIASTLISTYRSAQEAFQAGMSVGGPLAPVLATLYAANAVAQGLARVAAIRSVSEGGSSGAGSFSRSAGVTSTQATTNPINERFNLSNNNQGMTVVASWKEATEVRNRVEFKESLITV